MLVGDCDLTSQSLKTFLINHSRDQLFEFLGFIPVCADRDLSANIESNLTSITDNVIIILNYGSTVCGTLEPLMQSMGTDNNYKFYSPYTPCLSILSNIITPMHFDHNDIEMKNNFIKIVDRFVPFHEEFASEYLSQYLIWQLFLTVTTDLKSFEPSKIIPYLKSYNLSTEIGYYNLDTYNAFSQYTTLHKANETKPEISYQDYFYYLYHHDTPAITCAYILNQKYDDSYTEKTFLPFLINYGLHQLSNSSYYFYTIIVDFSTFGDDAIDFLKNYGKEMLIFSGDTFNPTSYSKIELNTFLVNSNSNMVLLGLYNTWMQSCTRNYLTMGFSMFQSLELTRNYIYSNYNPKVYIVFSEVELLFQTEIETIFNEFTEVLNIYVINETNKGPITLDLIDDYYQKEGTIFILDINDNLFMYIYDELLSNGFNKTTNIVTFLELNAYGMTIDEDGPTLTLAISFSIEMAEEYALLTQLVTPSEITNYTLETMNLLLFLSLLRTTLMNIDTITMSNIKNGLIVNSVRGLYIILDFSSEGYLYKTLYFITYKDLKFEYTDFKNVIYKMKNYPYNSHINCDGSPGINRRNISFILLYYELNSKYIDSSYLTLMTTLYHFNNKYELDIQYKTYKLYSPNDAIPNEALDPLLTKHIFYIGVEELVEIILNKINPDQYLWYTGYSGTISSIPNFIKTGISFNQILQPFLTWMYSMEIDSINVFYKNEAPSIIYKKILEEEYKSLIDVQFYNDSQTPELYNDDPIVFLIPIDSLNDFISNYTGNQMLITLVYDSIELLHKNLLVYSNLPHADILSTSDYFGSDFNWKTKYTNSDLGSYLAISFFYYSAVLSDDITGTLKSLKLKVNGVYHRLYYCNQVSHQFSLIKKHDSSSNEIVAKTKYPVEINSRFFNKDLLSEEITDNFAFSNSPKKVDYHIIVFMGCFTKSYQISRGSLEILNFFFSEMNDLYQENFPFYLDVYNLKCDINLCEDIGEYVLSMNVSVVFTTVTRECEETYLETFNEMNVIVFTSTYSGEEKCQNNIVRNGLSNKLITDSIIFFSIKLPVKPNIILITDNNRLPLNILKTEFELHRYSVIQFKIVKSQVLDTITTIEAIDYYLSIVVLDIDVELFEQYESICELHNYYCISLFVSRGEIKRRGMDFIYFTSYADMEKGSYLDFKEKLDHFIVSTDNEFEITNEMISLYNSLNLYNTAYSAAKTTNSAQILSELRGIKLNLFDDVTTVHSTNIVSTTLYVYEFDTEFSIYKLFQYRSDLTKVFFDGGKYTLGNHYCNLKKEKGEDLIYSYNVFVIILLPMVYDTDNLGMVLIDYTIATFDYFNKENLAYFNYRIIDETSDIELEQLETLQFDLIIGGLHYKTKNYLAELLEKKKFIFFNIAYYDSNFCNKYVIEAGAYIEAFIENSIKALSKVETQIIIVSDSDIISKQAENYLLYYLNFYMFNIKFLSAYIDEGIDEFSGKIYEIISESGSNFIIFNVMYEKAYSFLYSISKLSIESLEKEIGIISFFTDENLIDYYLLSTDITFYMMCTSYDSIANFSNNLKLIEVHEEFQKYFSGGNLNIKDNFRFGTMFEVVYSSINLLFASQFYTIHQGHDLIVKSLHNRLITSAGGVVKCFTTNTLSRNYFLVSVSISDQKVIPIIEIQSLVAKVWSSISFEDYYYVCNWGRTNGEIGSKIEYKQLYMVYINDYVDYPLEYVRLESSFFVKYIDYLNTYNKLINSYFKPYLLSDVMSKRSILPLLMAREDVIAFFGCFSSECNKFIPALLENTNKILFLLSYNKDAKPNKNTIKFNANPDKIFFQLFTFMRSKKYKYFYSLLREGTNITAYDVFYKKFTIDYPEFVCVGSSIYDGREFKINGIENETLIVFNFLLDKDLKSFIFTNYDKGVRHIIINYRNLFEFDEYKTSLVNQYVVSLHPTSEDSKAILGFSQFLERISGQKSYHPNSLYIYLTINMLLTGLNSMIERYGEIKYDLDLLLNYVYRSNNQYFDVYIDYSNNAHFSLIIYVVNDAFLFKLDHTVSSTESYLQPKYFKEENPYYGPKLSSFPYTLELKVMIIVSSTILLIINCLFLLFIYFNRTSKYIENSPLSVLMAVFLNTVLYIFVDLFSMFTTDSKAKCSVIMWFSYMSLTLTAMILAYSSFYTKEKFIDKRSLKRITNTKLFLIASVFELIILLIGQFLFIEEYFI